MRSVFLAFLLIAPGPSPADAVQSEQLAQARTPPRIGRLSAGEVRRALLGRSVKGEYPDGRQWTEAFRADMTSRYVENGQVSRGAMRFDGSHLCFTYASGFSGGCFEVWRRSANCFDFYAIADDGTVTATARQRLEGQGWTARAWFENERSTCIGDQIA